MRTAAEAPRRFSELAVSLRLFRGRFLQLAALDHWNELPLTIPVDEIGALLPVPDDNRVPAKVLRLDQRDMRAVNAPNTL